MLNVVLQTLGFVFWGLRSMSADQFRQGLPICIACILATGVSAFVIYAAPKMMSLQRHSAALVASVLAMFFGGACVIGLPIGIWALVAINRPEVPSCLCFSRWPT